MNPKLSPKEFIVAMRRANRDQKIKLIDQYVGYDPTGNFGAQECFALRKAMVEARQV